ncbi:ATP-dependent endonuclease [Rossellomorea sp. KS-H15a]|uniref:ATP-dependent nuclease n=1 Tax=Rossellomorea sp. KS-H15a TaxID=2963940 RepID=UPI0020C73164|nr:AAA family ATPase [Rossellomorea sp. KS-H15a]UTE76757.1 AAA family ATPase [Rossellomorea sp. KS-H15a]
MDKISRIVVKRFRSIIDLEINLNVENNYMSLCGENNSGKTNTLRALDIFFNPDKYIAENDSPYHKIEGTRGGAVFPEILIDFETTQKQTIRIIRKFDKRGLEHTVGIKNARAKKIERIKMTEKEIKEYLDSFSFFFIESINISTPQVINNIIDDIYDLEYAKSQFRGAKKELKDAFDKYVEGLDSILQQLADEINPKFKEYKENWGVGFDIPNDIKKFRDLITDDIDFYINDRSNKRIDGKGAGLQRLAHILLHFKIIEKIKNKNVIFLIDEPDVYLHEGLQKKLYRDLKQLGKHVQTFVTTHSQIFIDTYRLENVYLLELQISSQYFKRRKRDYSILETKLVNFNEDTGKEKIREYLGISIEDYEVLQQYNILVEGETDKKYIHELIKYFDYEAPNIIAAHGADKIIGYLEFYDSYYRNIKQKSYKPKILVILDNDLKGREVFKKIGGTKSGKYKHINVFCMFVPNFLGEITEEKFQPDLQIEDLLYPKVLVFLVNQLLKKKDLKSINEKDVIDKIEKPAHKNKGILYLVENLKNDKNPDDGQTISFTNSSGSSDQIKTGIVGSFNIMGNPKLAELLNEEKEKYVEVEKFINRIINSSTYFSDEI